MRERYIDLSANRISKLLRGEYMRVIRTRRIKERTFRRSFGRKPPAVKVNLGFAQIARLDRINSFARRFIPFVSSFEILSDVCRRGIAAKSPRALFMHHKESAKYRSSARLVRDAHHATLSNIRSYAADLLSSRQ